MLTVADEPWEEVPWVPAERLWTVPAPGAVELERLRRTPRPGPGLRWAGSLAPVALSADGQLAVVFGSEGMVVGQTSTGDRWRTVAGAVDALASPGWDLLAVAFTDRVELWRTTNLECVAVLAEGSSPFDGVWSPDGSRLAVLASDGLHWCRSDGTGSGRWEPDPETADRPGGTFGIDVRWYPDSRRVALLAVRRPDAVSAVVTTVDTTSGDGPTVLDVREPSGNAYVTMTGLDLSPEGTLVVEYAYDWHGPNHSVWREELRDGAEVWEPRERKGRPPSDDPGDPSTSADDRFRLTQGPRSGIGALLTDEPVDIPGLAAYRTRPVPLARYQLMLDDTVTGRKFDWTWFGRNYPDAGVVVQPPRLSADGRHVVVINEGLSVVRTHGGYMVRLGDEQPPALVEDAEYLLLCGLTWTEDGAGNETNTPLRFRPGSTHVFMPTGPAATAADAVGDLLVVLHDGQVTLYRLPPEQLDEPTTGDELDPAAQ